MVRDTLIKAHHDRHKILVNSMILVLWLILQQNRDYDPLTGAKSSEIGIPDTLGGPNYLQVIHKVKI